METNITLVIGANGKIGKKTVKLLRDEGVLVRAMIRDQTQASDFEALGAEVVLADLEADFSAAFEGCQNVIFTAGSGASTGFDKTLLIDLWAAIKAINYAGEYDVQRFIMVSSRGATNPDNGPERIKPYLVAKHAADFVLQTSNLNYTILQPGRLVDETGKGLIQTIRPTEATEQMISRDDVASVIFYSFNHEHTIGTTVELFNGSEPISTALAPD
ncbi:hypothetical protein A9Q79_01410 [Methylophaga sp. 42_25_T18]|nr:hypothetical protein A9Q79_01410 [Methylophaga sp. 42_25_T18]OUR86340.1 hypothetical protein A9Q92_05985 [Methylophaga sp. 42_8_T64]